jgi:adenylate cyclase
MNALWRGTLATRARIISGLLLMLYALFHFINIGFGLFSAELIERGQDWRQVVTRTLPGEILLYGAFAVHSALALTGLLQRRTLRMPPVEATQYILGFVIPFLLITHIVHTRIAHEQLAVDDQMSYIIVLIFGTASGWKQALLLLIVWVHGCIGLHMWLRGWGWWRHNVAALCSFATLIPAFALAGFLVHGRRMAQVFAVEDDRLDFMDDVNFPGPSEFGQLIRLTDQLLAAALALVVAAVGFVIVRRIMARRTSVHVQYKDGPRITAAKGLTLLEMSRAAGVPHTSLCGGKGRCTTCRVVIEAGQDHLPAPDATEMRSLKAVGASGNTRLACQIRPTEDVSVYRVFGQEGQRKRAHASQGLETELAVLFLDMRGFTARTTGQLPYDVVFLLNRFFDSIVPEIVKAGGTVDKYMGDGLLALFETTSPKLSAQAALAATDGITDALAHFNAQLVQEGSPEVRIGIGLHLGTVVLGEIGAAGRAPRTLIGDTVNTASRLEGQTKALGAQVLISQSILDAAGMQPIDQEPISLELRGVEHPLDAVRIAHGAYIRDALTPA